jgi:CSLREA domain-containing protein
MNGTVCPRLALGLVLVTAALTLATPAYATNIGVTTTADEDNADGDCSLREAVIAANTNTGRDACAAGSGTDTIRLTSTTYELSVPEGVPNDATVGDLDISGVTIISGAGADATTIRGAAGFNHRILENTGTTTLSGLTITGGDMSTPGFSGTGGGVRNDGGALTLNRVTVVGNNDEGRGGGVEDKGGTLNVTQSTISDNQTVGGAGGGGLAVVNGSEASIVNSTISGNRAESSPGGGILVADSATLSIESSTIASNNAPTTGFGGIFAVGDPTTTVNVKNTIVSDNATTDCATNFSATITSLGHNLNGGDSCGFTQPTDQEGTDPLLGPPSDNGGPTQTHALLAGSPARDEGASDQGEDQRGKVRPQDGDGTATDDIGAFEKGSAPPPPNTAPKITPLSPDPGSSTSDRTPQIRARITDQETNLRKENMKLFVDGNRKLGFDYDRSNDRLTFSIKAKLDAGRRHNVRIEATDGELDTTKSWRFRIKRTNDARNTEQGPRDETRETDWS